ncbi:GNAT family N-acetyltransferase [Candidatus Saccharibacteria bacterium]|nr:GNAT family N-acetyltransferase [Candidatus Saccharibacteria bacterium]
MMKVPVLETNNPHLKLIEPDIERDAANGIKWLEGDMGRTTLRLMGVADEHNKPTTLEAEKERVNDFLTRQDQLNWMIEYQGKVVGSVWVDLEASDFLASPSVHIMIGDLDMRGKGVGLASVSTIIEYLKSNGEKTIYSRYVTTNEVSEHLLSKLGFEPLGEPYNDGDLLFQNVSLDLGTPSEGAS